VTATCARNIGSEGVCSGQHGRVLVERYSRNSAYTASVPTLLDSWRKQLFPHRPDCDMLPNTCRDTLRPATACSASGYWYRRWNVLRSEQPSRGRERNQRTGLTRRRLRVRRFRRTCSKCLRDCDIDTGCSRRKRASCLTSFA